MYIRLMPDGTSVRSEAPAISIAAPGESSAVDAFVEAHPLATLYHRTAILRTVRRAGGLEVASFVARRAGGGREIAGVLPVALTRSLLFGTYATSLPYFSYGGALVAPGENGACARALVDAAWAWASARGARHLVLRHSADRPLDLPAAHAKETLTLALPGDAGALWKAIGPKPRNLVRKAQKAGLAARAEGAGGLRDFHRVLSENMRDLGSPAQGEAFYRILLEEVGATAEVHVVRAGAEAAAAAITLRFRDRVEVPWASCLRRYNDVAANMLLYWHLLEHAARAGARVFDFGRSTRDSGPYRFKLQWGARPEPLPWYYVATSGTSPVSELSPSNPRFGRAIRLWRRLPVAVARAVGARLARSLP
jgi:FemAB-related protein (PEP-CTERM system-associated)